MSKKIYGLVLAAGCSSRMGDFKPLMPFRNKTIIEVVIDEMIAAGIEKIIVVLGYRGEDIRSTLLDETNHQGKRQAILEFVENTDYANTQMLDSIKIGLKQMTGCAWFFVTPADMPAIQSDTYRKLIEKSKFSSKKVIFPTLDGYRKHPPCVSWRCAEEILNFQGQGLRELWKRYELEQEIEELSVRDRGCNIDVDYKEDYQVLKEKYEDKKNDHILYFDNAATTRKKPSEVYEAVYVALMDGGNAARGVNAVSLNAARMVWDTRVELAKFFGFPSPDRVCFTSNATEGLNCVIQGLFQTGDHVITTVMEHNSVLRPLARMEEKCKLTITYVPSDTQGVIALETIANSIRENTKAVVIHHASNVTGNITDLYQLGEICRKKNVLLIVDAAQTAGVVPIDMEKMQIDVLCITGHKGLMGPQGTGAILVGENVRLEPLKEGGTGIHSYDKRQPKDYPEHLEAGTLNGPGIAGLNAALQVLGKKGVKSLHEREMELTWMFYEGIKDLPGIRIYGHFSKDVPRCAIVSLNLQGYESGELADILMEEYEIATRSGAHCAPLAHEALGTVDTGMVRFSFSWMNTREEVQQAIIAMKKIAEEE